MKRTPKLRFPEFSETWIIDKLGDLVEISTGKKDTKDKVENGTYPFFVRSQNIEKINSYSFDGEAILTAGDGVGVGKVFHYINRKFDYHQRVYKISNFSKNINGRYIYEYFKLNFIREVTKYTAKTSVDSVRMDMIANMNIMHPCFLEQEKIASFFSLIDKKIEKQQQKVEVLEEYKKGIMQKIFSQEIRFKEFGGNWKTEKLKKYAEKITKKNKDFIITNIISNSAKHGLISQKDFFDKDIANEKNIDGYYVIEKDDFVYNPRKSIESPYGPVNKYNLNEKGIVSPLYLCFKINDKIDPEFLEYYFKTDKWYRFIYLNSDQGARHDRVSIKDTDFFNLDITIPNIDEQRKISKFLNTVENKFNIEKEKLAQLKEWKKVLLQQMFV